MEETQLKADAASAWEYFDWGAATFDAMVPSTAWFEDGVRQGDPFATMWDLALERSRIQPDHSALGQRIGRWML